VDDQDWPRGTVGHLAGPQAALVTCGALLAIALVLVAAALALLLGVKVFA
jgi:hypothetical protein